MKRAEGNYFEHAPVVDETTTTEELLEYVRHQTMHPIKRAGCQIYYYSSHRPDYDALRELALTVEDGEYIVPFQVDSAWTFMWSHLPELLRRNADFMFYATKSQEYRHYPNYYNMERVDMKTAQEYEAEISKAYLWSHD